MELKHQIGGWIYAKAEQRFYKVEYVHSQIVEDVPGFRAGEMIYQLWLIGRQPTSWYHSEKINEWYPYLANQHVLEVLYGT